MFFQLAKITTYTHSEQVYKYMYACTHTSAVLVNPSLEYPGTRREASDDISDEAFKPKEVWVCDKLMCATYRPLRCVMRSGSSGVSESAVESRIT